MKNREKTSALYSATLALAVAHLWFPLSSAAEVLERAPFRATSLGVSAEPSTGIAEQGCDACVTISPHGGPGDLLVDRDGGYRAVRFDPPFETPFIVREISFPSFTHNGVPAAFPSIRLCGADQANGRPLLTNTYFLQAPFVGSPDGVNHILLSTPITEPGLTLYFVVEFPRRGPTYPNDHPFMRSEAAYLTRGSYMASYQIGANGVALGGGGAPGNLVANLVCEVGSPDLVPIVEPTNLGANRLTEAMEFTFRTPEDRRANGSMLPPHSLRRVDLMYRQTFGPWTLVASTGAGSSAIKIDSLPRPPTTGFWAVQAVDRNGRRSALSSVEVTFPYTTSLPEHPQGYGPEEPDAKFADATVLVPPVDALLSSIFPTADRDFYELAVKAGDVIHVVAGVSPFATFDNLDLAIAVYDGSKRLVAFDDNSGFGTNPELTYEVPSAVGGREDGRSQRVTIEVFDIRGSSFSPATNRRVPALHTYRLSVSVAKGTQRAFDDNINGQADRICMRTIGASPKAGGVSFEIEGGRDPWVEGRWDLRIYDVHGRLVKRFEREATGAGKSYIHWDGTDSRGARLPSGVYFVQFSSGSQALKRKVSLLH